MQHRQTSSSFATLFRVSRKAALAAVGCSLVGTLQACAFDVMIGNGERMVELREETDFTAIEANSFLDTHLEIGDRHEIALTCDSNLVEVIETRVDGETLVISSPRNTSVTTELNCRADIMMPAATQISNRGSGDFASESDLEAVESIDNTGSGDLLLESVRRVGALVTIANTGSGDLAIVNLEVETVDVANQGSGDVALGGEVESAELTNTGSGDIDTRVLEANEVVIHNTGSGDVTANASESASGELSGSGDVEIFGEPASRDFAVSGSGGVRYR